MSGFNFNTDKLLSRMFRKADGVVWDMMTGKIGVLTDEGIATLEGTGDDARINVNLFDDFGMQVPAFAQSTPVVAVNPGDIIYFGARNNVGWIIEKDDSKGADKISFKLLKADGQTSSWKPPKVTTFGIDGGVMVLRSLMTMLPGGSGDLSKMQNALMPMAMMGMLGDNDGGMIEKMMPLMLMQSMGGGDPAGMGNMMQMMLMMKMMGKDTGDLFGGSTKSKPTFNRGGPFDRG